MMYTCAPDLIDMQDERTQSDTSDEQTSNEVMRAGRAAIIGRPNVGKSTLLNALLGQKLVIASPRPGTTRACVLGVMIQQAPPTQLAFIDTPGFERPKNEVGKILVRETRESLQTADCILFVTDFKPKRAFHTLDKSEEPLFDILAQAKLPALLAVNKVDLAKDKGKLLPLLSHYQKRFPFVSVVPVSATKAQQLEALTKELRCLLPEGRLYDEETLTDRPMRFFAAELIREAVFLETRQEVPYGAAVIIDEFTEDLALLRITATVVVERPGHKGIVIGKAGERLKAIGTRARQGLEAMVGQKVFLQLWVKVVEDWTTSPQKAKQLLDESAQ